MWRFYVLIGSGEIVLPEGVRHLTEDEERWVSVSGGKDKEYVCEFDSESTMVLTQTDRPIPKVIIVKSINYYQLI